MLIEQLMGIPSERNAHPRQSGGISLVHNGIIENYAEIREQLQALGIQLSSNTTFGTDGTF